MSNRRGTIDHLDLPSRIPYKETILVIEHTFNDGFLFIPAHIRSKINLKRGDKILMSIQKMDDEKTLVDILPE